MVSIKFLIVFGIAFLPGCIAIEERLTVFESDRERAHFNRSSDLETAILPKLKDFIGIAESSLKERLGKPHRSYANIQFLVYSPCQIGPCVHKTAEQVLTYSKLRIDQTVYPYPVDFYIVDGTVFKIQLEINFLIDGSRWQGDPRIQAAWEDSVVYP